MSARNVYIAQDPNLVEVMPCILLTSYRGFERVWCYQPQVQAFQKGVACLLHPEDGGSVILRNVGKYLVVGTA
jgi:hypothetical protein